MWFNINAKKGKQQKLFAYLNKKYGQDFLILKAEQALALQLYGPDGREAKRIGDYDKGVPQLLMQLKAIQENEGMKDKWYYGFAATKELWTPCRVNMKRNEGEQVQIGMKQAINTTQLGSFCNVLYLMKGMILKEFD